MITMTIMSFVAFTSGRGFGAVWTIMFQNRIENTCPKTWSICCRGYHHMPSDQHKVDLLVRPDDFSRHSARCASTRCQRLLDSEMYRVTSCHDLAARTTLYRVISSAYLSRTECNMIFQTVNAFIASRRVTWCLSQSSFLQFSEATSFIQAFLW